MPFAVEGGASVTGVLSPLGSAPAVGGGSIRIEPEHVDQAIKIFQDAYDELTVGFNTIFEKLQMQPPGGDPVSADGAQAFNTISLDSSNSAVQSWMGALDQVGQVILQLQNSKQQHLENDMTQATAFRG
jgi:hypothetical protein